MRIGIIACEMMKREIEMITSNDPDVVHREYIQWGLHSSPEILLRTVVGKVNELEGNVDVVFLGYAICSSLGNVRSSIKLPFVMLQDEDCIGSMLGREEYIKERSAYPGTWFSTPGWAVLGINGVVREDQMVGLPEHGFDQIYFAKALLNGYSRCLFIDTGVGEEETYASMTKDLACKIGLLYEARKGELRSIREAWNKVKTFPLKDQGDE